MNNSRNHFLATVAVIAVSGPAYAAPPAPVSTWQGGYIGALIGGGQDNARCNFLSTNNTTPTTLPCSNGGVATIGQPGFQNSTATGLVAGGQAGYDLQSRSFVYGVVADWTWTGMKSNTVLTTAPVSVPSLNTKVNWLASFRGRVGWAFDDIQTLFYATGGLALGHTQDSASWVSNSVGSGSVAWNASSSAVRTGWVAGGGIEHKLTKNLSILAECLYYDLGSKTASGLDHNTPPLTYTTAFNHTEIVGRVGLNWRF